jgi:pimeloyl-ACP methyl ester carboxylesterase
LALHRLLKSIDGFYKSYSLNSSDRPAANAIVFAHGFAGSPTATWMHFHHMSEEYAPDYPWYTDSDLFFYKYDSIRKAILYNASQFRTFLVQTLSETPNPAREFQPGTRWKYKKLLLVGHSEGGVVIRRMVLDRFQALTKYAKKTGQTPATVIRSEAPRDLILNSQLFLFAPAIGGTNFAGLLGFAHGASRLIAAIASSSTARNELLPTSQTLKDLKEGTQAGQENHPEVQAMTARILFGSDDHVVSTTKYEEDEMVEPYAEGHTHSSICKPTYVYKRPLELVRP